MCADKAIDWKNKETGPLVKVGNPTLGTDPEIFAKVGNKLLPAFAFLPRKENAIKFIHPEWDYESRATGQTYWDGFQAEWRFLTGKSCMTFLVMAMQSAIQTVVKRARKIDKNAKLTLENVVRIPNKLLQESLDDHVELGCLPSQNAYGDAGIRPGDPRKLVYRFAGGHIHIGMNAGPRERDHVRVVKNLDKILGVWAVGAAQSFDNPVRRQYYGKAGEYRKPEYGLEYRTLSNFWVASPYTARMALEIGRLVYKLSFDKTLDLWAATEEETRQAINKCDIKLAQSILKRNQGLFKWMFSMRDWSKRVTDVIYETGLNGIEFAIQDPSDFDENWGLDKKCWTYVQTPKLESYKGKGF